MVAANLGKGNHGRPDYHGVPSVAFTASPIAAVGLGEAETRAQGLDLRVNCERTSAWFHSPPGYRRGWTCPSTQAAPSRRCYIAAYAGEMLENWTAELEAELAEKLQDWSRFEPNSPSKG